MTIYSHQPHVLVVDDDARLRSLLVKYLSENSFLVSGVADAAEARTCIKSIEFDAIILDLMMPGETGLEFADQLRKYNNIPILMLTAMNEPENRIEGLELGADDYLAKPFEPRELLIRLNNILRHRYKNADSDEKINMGEFVFLPYRGELKKDGVVIRLTEIEAALLTALSKRAGQIINRDDLIELTGANGGGRAVDVQVTRLRRKIEINPKIPRYLQTVRGRGYVLKPD